MYHYHPFNPLADTAQLANDLRWNLMRPQGLEALMRLRSSTGLSIQDYYGCFSRRAGAQAAPRAPRPPGTAPLVPRRRTFTDLDLPAIDSDKCIYAQLQFDGSELKEGDQVYLQAALLYTTTAGERRIRVHTMALPVAGALGQVFRGADLDVQVGLLARRLAGQMSQHHLFTGEPSPLCPLTGVPMLLTRPRRPCSS